MPTTTLTPELQSFVVTSSPNVSFDTTTYLMVGEIATAVDSSVSPPGQNPVGIYYSWLRFDLSSIPAGAIITSATLSLDTAYIVASDYTTVQFGVTRSTDVTVTGNVTYNTSPFGSLTGSTYVGYFNVGVATTSPQLKVMTQAALPTSKLAILLAGSGLADNWVVIESSKYAGVSTPALIVDYVLGGDVITTFFE